MMAQYALSELSQSIARCTHCAERFRATETAHDPKPIFQVSETARLCIAGQAPGLRAHNSGRPFTDPSGVRLREWLAIDEETFYDPTKLLIAPMAFCFPGYNKNKHDLPPPADFWWDCVGTSCGLTVAPPFMAQQCLAERKPVVQNRYSSPTSLRGSATYWLMLIAAFLVSSCARSDGNAFPLADLSIPASATSEVTKEGRRDYTIGTGETSIALSQWPQEGEVNAVVLAVHGYGDHGTSTFEVAAKDWAPRGITTYAYDQRGFGRNPSNSDWPGSDALIDDLGKVTSLIRQKHPGVPLTLVGHSMGGGVIAAALGEGRVKPDRAVLLAPALWGGENLSPFLRLVAHTANAFAPNKRWTGDGIVTIQASDNIEMLRGLGRDPLYVRNPSSREFVGLIRIMDRAVSSAPQVTTPILVAYGENDEVVPEEPILAAYEQFSGPKEYRKIDTGWHMLLRDLEGEIVRDLVAEYVLAE